MDFGIWEAILQSEVRSPADLLVTKHHKLWESGVISTTTDTDDGQFEEWSKNGVDLLLALPHSHRGVDGRSRCHSEVESESQMGRRIG